MIDLSCIPQEPEDQHEVRRSRADLDTVPGLRLCGGPSPPWPRLVSAKCRSIPLHMRALGSSVNFAADAHFAITE